LPIAWFALLQYFLLNKQINIKKNIKDKAETKDKTNKANIFTVGPKRYPFMSQ